MQPGKDESLARLRHELRTPVNHVLGYSEILIEDAVSRNLEGHIPTLERIRVGGRSLLDSIQTHLHDNAGSSRTEDLAEFRQNLRALAQEALDESTNLSDDLKESHRQTMADLDAISWALGRLLNFTGQEAAHLSRAAMKIEVPSSPGTAPRKQVGGKILIADDDHSNRHLLRRRLEFEGHEVHEASNGREVVEYLKDQLCDLILLDLMMPEMDGFQTLAKLKQDWRTRELPVVMISALDEMQSVVRCIEMGAEDYLPKPFDRVLLRARIGACLDKKWLRDRERQKTEELEQTLRLLEAAQEKLAAQATQDPLTGLANRRYLDSQLEARVRRGSAFSVIYIDLNGFKKINDSYGHRAGDDLLRMVGERLRSAFRSTDLVGRWGGDEFVAIVDVDLQAAQANAARISDCFKREFAIGSGGSYQQVQVGAALGVAAWQTGEAVADVLQRADAAMYDQKLLSAH